MTEDEELALKDVNKVRKELGLEPLIKLMKGYPGLAHMCPISRSCRRGFTKLGRLPLDITNSGSSIAQHGPDGRATKVWRTNNGTRRFTTDFDRGLYPHLAQRGGPNPDGFIES